MMTPPSRLPDWPQRLHACITAARNKRFAWGAHDCFTFAAGCVQAITGADPLADFRGAYHGRAQAHALLAQMGGVQAAATSRMGEPIALAMCGVGDIVLTSSARGQFLAVCNGQTLLAPAAKGLAVLGLETAVLGWRVGG